MTPRRILAAGWLVFLLYAWPGYMQTDAADELVDSRVGVITDWHSPMMTEVWRIVGRVVSGPAGMLLVQSALALAGVYVLLRRDAGVRARTAAIAAVCVLLVPPVAATTALVSEEAQLAGFLLAGWALLATRRPWGLALVAVACGMRDGAGAAALPVVLVAFRWGELAGWRRVAVALLAWLAAVAVAAGAKYVIVDERTERGDVAFAMADVVGTLANARELPDVEVRDALAGAPLADAPELQRRARALYGKTSGYAKGDQRIFDPPVTDAERDGLYAGRRAIVLAAPGGYLAHRARRFAGTLGLAPKAWTPVHTEFAGSPKQFADVWHAATHSTLQDVLIAPTHALADTFVFRPYVYLGLALVFLPLALVRRQRLPATLLASGILYELALAVVEDRGELRDSHWLVVTTVLAIVALVALQARKVRVDEKAPLRVAGDDGV